MTQQINGVVFCHRSVLCIIRRVFVRVYFREQHMTQQVNGIVFRQFLADFGGEQTTFVGIVIVMGQICSEICFRIGSSVP